MAEVIGFTISRMKNFGYYLYLYLYLFVPVVGGSSRKTYYIIYFLVALFVLLKYKKQSKIAMRKLGFVTWSIVLLFAYVVFNTIVNGANPIIFTATIGMVIVPYTSALSFIALYDYKRRRDIASDMLTVSIAASVISLTLYLIPALGEYFLFLQAGDELRSIMRFYEDGRGYGIAGSLFFGYSIIQAIVVFITLRYIKGNRKYVYIVVIFASMILNARIGLFLLAALMIMSYCLFTSARQVIKSLLGIGIIVLFVIESGVYQYFKNSIDWMMEGFYMASDFLFNTDYGPSEGHFSGLADRFLIWPKGMQEWLIGSGKYILYGSNRGSSDVGFILQLNWGGLVFFLLLLTPYIYMMKQSVQTKKYNLVLIILLSIGIGNWKGDLFMQSNFLFITTILYYTTICKNETVNDNHSRI